MRLTWLIRLLLHLSLMACCRLAGPTYLRVQAYMHRHSLRCVPLKHVIKKFLLCEEYTLKCSSPRLTAKRTFFDKQLQCVHEQRAVLCTLVHDLTAESFCCFDIRCQWSKNTSDWRRKLRLFSSFGTAALCGVCVPPLCLSWNNSGILHMKCAVFLPLREARPRSIEALISPPQQSGRSCGELENHFQSQLQLRTVTEMFVVAGSTAGLHWWELTTGMLRLFRWGSVERGSCFNICRISRERDEQ